MLIINCSFLKERHLKSANWSEQHALQNQNWIHVCKWLYGFVERSSKKQESCVGAELNAMNASTAASLSSGGESPPCQSPSTVSTPTSTRNSSNNSNSSNGSPASCASLPFSAGYGSQQPSPQPGSNKVDLAVAGTVHQRAGQCQRARQHPPERPAHLSVNINEPTNKPMQSIINSTITNSIQFSSAFNFIGHSHTNVLIDILCSIQL